MAIEMGEALKLGRAVGRVLTCRERDRWQHADQPDSTERHCHVSLGKEEATAYARCTCIADSVWQAISRTVRVFAMQPDLWRQVSRCVAPLWQAYSTFTPLHCGIAMVSGTRRTVQTLSTINASHATMLSNLTPAEIRDALATRTDLLLVDVREPAEYAIAHIEGATLMPMQTIPEQLATLPRDREIILHCHHGMRSEMAGNFLLAQGFSRVSHMVGGIDRWSDDVDPAIVKY